MILSSIANGTFDYNLTFPNSPNAKKYKPTSSTKIKALLQDWLESVKHSLHSSTYQSHKRTINGVLTNAFGHLAVGEIQWLDIKNWSKKATQKFKTQNNYISILRTALDDAVEDGMIEVNPLHGKKLRKRLDSVAKVDGIDPFTEIEREAILANCSGQIRNFIQFSMWTGMRPSEIKALIWDDIDWIAETINVNKALTDDSPKPEKPKTKNSVRRVKILPAAMDALLSQKEHTFLENMTIFQNPRTGGILHQRSMIKTYWTRTLKLANVRYRYPYQMRHTYATMMILAGEPIYWVSQQLGHGKPSFTIDTYFRFIPSDMPNAGSLAAEKWGKKSCGKSVAKAP